MRLGVILPSFTSSAAPCLAAARAAEQAGMHGVFLYDHLWPLGHPEQPALSSFPLLGALCAETSQMLLGPLVARVGLVSDVMLFDQMLSVDRLSGGRLIAGIGTGDSASAAENLSFGIDFTPPAHRRAALAEVARALLQAGICTWIGGGSKRTNDLARELAVPLNLWQASSQQLQAAAAAGPVTWAGNFPRDPAAAVSQLESMAQAGASWTIYAWPGAMEPIVRAARGAGIELGA